MLYMDGEYYAVKFDDDTYYNGRGLLSSGSQTTKNIQDAELWQFKWQIDKDIYLEQFLYSNKNISIKEYVKVKLKTNIEIVKE